MKSSHHGWHEKNSPGIGMKMPLARVLIIAIARFDVAADRTLTSMLNCREKFSLIVGELPDGVAASRCLDRSLLLIEKVFSNLTSYLNRYRILGYLASRAISDGQNLIN